MDEETELKIRIEARSWHAEKEVGYGLSENESENFALHFFERGVEESNKLAKDKSDYTMNHLVGIKKLDSEKLIIAVKTAQKSFEEGYEKGLIEGRKWVEKK